VHMSGAADCGTAFLCEKWKFPQEICEEESGGILCSVAIRGEHSSDLCNKNRQKTASMQTEDMLGTIGRNPGIWLGKCSFSWRIPKKNRDLNLDRCAKKRR